MNLHSTYGESKKVNFKTALFKSMPSDNGLYTMKKFPRFDKAWLEKAGEMSLQDISFDMAKALLSDEIPEEDLKRIIENAINFEAPIVSLKKQYNVMELFHGPSMAFKDFGARFMAQVMSYYLGKKKEKMHLLVATSGDTGGAVALGFLDVPNIEVTILYPSKKVSPLQELQLTTLGKNITAVEVDGTFDDCQRMVKSAFQDEALNKKYKLSSANSINIARLIPQSFYYMYAGTRKEFYGKRLLMSIPSGNLGNLCAGIIAWKMGLPVRHFIAATNANNVLQRFLGSAEYEPKPAVQTLANAMDVGMPSNFPRLIEFFQRDFLKITNQVKSYSFDDFEIEEAIKEVYDETEYIMCPHTAVGYLGLKEYIFEYDCTDNGIILSTAHPAKFAGIVEKHIFGKVPVPEQLQSLDASKKKSVAMSNKSDDFKIWFEKTY